MIKLFIEVGENYNLKHLIFVFPMIYFGFYWVSYTFVIIITKPSNLWLLKL